MLVKTDKLSSTVCNAIDRFLVPKSSQSTSVHRRFRGSFFRKRNLSPVTDIDVEVAVGNACEIPTLALRTASTVCAPLYFLYADCGERSDIVPPWCISENGCVERYNQAEVEAWYSRVLTCRDIPPAATRQIQEVLGLSLPGGLDGGAQQQQRGVFRSDNMTTGQLSNIESIIRPFSSVVWSLEDLRTGTTSAGNEVFDLPSLVLSGRSLSVEYAYVAKNTSNVDDFCTIQVVFVKGGVGATRGGSEPLRVSNKFLSLDVPAIFKDVRWLLPENAMPLYVAAAESVEWDLARIHRQKLAQLLFHYAFHAAAERGGKVTIPQAVYQALECNNWAMSDQKCRGWHAKATSILSQALIHLLAFIPDDTVRFPKSRLVIEVQQNLS